MKRKIFLIIFLLVVIQVYKQCNNTIIIPNSAIRLRVIPNSNNPEDIYMKEKVKSYLEKNVLNLTNNISNIEEARVVLKESIPMIESNIETIFNTSNYKEKYQVDYGYNYFPEKTYKGINYKEGYYESLVISIGDAKGDNFWCVLFPNLCLVDNKEPKTYKLYIKELINKIF